MILSAWRIRSPLDRLLLMSVAALAFNTHGEPVPLLIFLGLFGVGTARPTFLRHWWLWMTIVVVQGGHQLLRWEGVDDHIILGTYWALAVSIGLLLGRPEQVLARSARWLIGLVFLFAASWKVSSADFRDGEFFTLYLLADPRFETMARLVGGIDQATYAQNTRAIASLYDVEAMNLTTTLAVGPRIRVLAFVMTWWGVVVETLLAVTWLAPLRGRMSSVRHLLLFVFCATTYGLVAISGFGAILLVMGMATVNEHARLRNSYAIAVIVLILWTPLWRLFVLR